MVGGILVDIQPYPGHHLSFPRFHGQCLYKYHGFNDAEEARVLYW